MQKDDKDNRFDTIIALLLAFGMAIGVWLYSVKPWQTEGGLFGRLKPAAVEVDSGVRAALPAREEPVPVAPLPSAVVEAQAPSIVPTPSERKLPEVAAPAVAAAAAVAVEPAKAEAPAPAPVEAVKIEPPPAPVVAPEPPKAPEPVAAAPEPAPAEPVKAPEPKIVIQERFNFAFGKADIPDSAKARLDEIAGLLKDDPRTLTIVGHTDNVGKPEANRYLSELRAKSVRQYLVDKGVAADRLKARGAGSAKPIASNKTEAGRAQNRRIDITE